MVTLDVVILQEMFEAGPRQERFLREAKARGFCYHCGSVWPRLMDTRLIDGGLLIVSRYPIVKRDQIVYTRGSGSDGVCAKGVLYARIQLASNVSESLHVFTTHTQAGDALETYRIRLVQLQEMQDFIARTLRDEEHEPGAPVFVTGDFNLDARHDLVHDARTGAMSSTRCSESDVYRHFVAGLERVVRDARVSAASLTEKAAEEVSRVVDLMKRYDTTKLGDEVHPITNGDGHAKLVHRSDPRSLEKDGKCIDYMFYFPSVQDQSKSSVRLTVVPKGTMVDHCAVSDLMDDNQLDEWITTSEAFRPGQLPITHLSDHYGLRAEFSLETTRVKRPDGQPSEKNESLASVLQLYFPHDVFAQRPRRLWKWKLAFALLAIVSAAGGVTVAVIQTLLKVVFT